MTSDAARGNVSGWCDRGMLLRANLSKTDAVGWVRVVNFQRHGSGYPARCGYAASLLPLLDGVTILSPH